VTGGALPRLYIVTDRHLPRGRSLIEVIDDALRGAPALVQLREKDLGGGPLRRLAAELLEVTRARGARLLINERVDVAMAVGADGVHLPERGFPIAEARALLGPDALIGASTHDPAGVARAVAAGVNLVVCGPVWPTPSKPGSSGFGTAGLRDAVRAAGQTPLYALGGVDTPDRAGHCVAAGAHGVAGIRAFLAAADPCTATRALFDSVADTV
jgi:thiamine-phosphate pyrophosphorylase